MAFFTAAQLAILASTTVRVALLAEFNYSPASRFWNGSYTLNTGGYDWYGLGGMASVEGLFESRSGEAQQVRFTLSGTNAEVNTIAVNEASEQTNKLARAFFQLFDERWATVGSPIPIWSGLTQPMTASSAAAAEGEGRVRSITLPCEGLFYGRSRPPAGLYTDRDQQNRFAGDLFFEFQALMKSYSYVWP